LYLPVPTMRRDWKALPAMTRGSMSNIVEPLARGGGI
jgi:hypothetical protein